MKAIGPVDVLMVPVGGIYTLNGETAKKVVEQLKPRLFVIPMHYGTQGVRRHLSRRTSSWTDRRTCATWRESNNSWRSRPDLKADKPTVVVMGWVAGARRAEGKK